MKRPKSRSKPAPPAAPSFTPVRSLCPPGVLPDAVLDLLDLMRQWPGCEITDRETKEIIQESGAFLLTCYAEACVAHFHAGGYAPPTAEEILGIIAPRLRPRPRLRPMCFATAKNDGRGSSGNKGKGR